MFIHILGNITSAIQEICTNYIKNNQPTSRESTFIIACLGIAIDPCEKIETKVGIEKCSPKRAYARFLCLLNSYPVFVKPVWNKKSYCDERPQ